MVDELPWHQPPQKKGLYLSYSSKTICCCDLLLPVTVLIKPVCHSLGQSFWVTAHFWAPTFISKPSHLPTLFFHSPSKFQLLQHIFMCFQLLSMVLRFEYTPPYVYELPQPFSGQTAHFWAHKPISDLLPHSDPFSHSLNSYHMFQRVLNSCQPPTSTWTHPQASTCIFKTTCAFFLPIFEHFRAFLNIFQLFLSFSNLFQAPLRTVPIPNHFCNLLPIFETYFHLFLAISTIFKPLNSISKLFSSTTTYLYPIPIVFATYQPFLNLLPIFTYFHLQPSTLCHVWIRPPHVWCMSHMASTQTTSLWKHLNGRDISNEQSSTMTYIANQCGTSTRRSCVLKLSFARESNNGQ